ncbi:DUF134 domain-containing protein [Haloferula sp. A504]|uniref:DUF134 domain-containing protein n=1 Tax=Haloferula sp. A504 TaxID=3373601 RepID=UPI0031CC0DB0|nr:DUF134 domain-containing protein [Verrucomicrobiaceae bacterium E54]
MARPKCPRVVSGTPVSHYFKPAGVPLRELREVGMPVDHFEAIRLADLEGLSQVEAARRMGVSRQTFGRILRQARTITARALVRGEALRIDSQETS